MADRVTIRKDMGLKRTAEIIKELMNLLLPMKPFCFLQMNCTDPDWDTRWNLDPFH